MILETPVKDTVDYYMMHSIMTNQGSFTLRKSWSPGESLMTYCVWENTVRLIRILYYITKETGVQLTSPNTLPTGIILHEKLTGINRLLHTTCRNLHSNEAGCMALCNQR